MEVELGFGPPHYLLDRALEVPEKNLVGIEWKRRFVRETHEKCCKRNITNVRAIFGNAWLLFGALFQENSLDAIHLNCPDPWWKAKHQKRRILADSFVETIMNRLKPGGILFLQTDVASILELYLERMEAHSAAINPYGQGRLCTKKPTAARSHRERRCVREGVPIFRGMVVKKGAQALLPIKDAQGISVAEVTA